MYTCPSELFCKRLLGVGTQTPNAAVLFELGRYPVALHYHLRCVKFWLKLLSMPDSRLPKSSYHMLKALDEQGRQTWASSVRSLLQQLDFGYVWTAQGVVNEDMFLSIFETRLKEHLTSELRTQLENCSKLAIYSTFKSRFEPELYLKCVTIRKHRVALSKLRLSNHALKIETGRHQGIEVANIICPMCMNQGNVVLEDEFHFIMCCPTYDVLRHNYLPHIAGTEVSYQVFIDVTSFNQSDLLAAYVYHAFKLRKSLIL